MRKGIIIIISAVALCVIAGGVLILTGVIHIPFKTAEKEPQKPVLCVEYMGSYMLVDSNGTVTGSTPEKPEDIPEISGISFSQIVVGETLVASEEASYAYAWEIVDSLKRNDLPASKIYVSSDQQATVYTGKIRVLLGADKQTEDKLKELRDFYDDLKDLSGTLDMQELSHNNLGYSLKPDKKDKKDKKESQNK